MADEPSNPIINEKKVDRGVSVDLLHEFFDLNTTEGSMLWKQRGRKWFKSDRDWKAWNSLYAGRPAFSTSNNWGYPRTRIFTKAFLAHRVVWAMTYGNWPSGQIDHINGDKTDNRIENLRIVTSRENHKNMPERADNTSGVKGVYWHKQRSKWHAEIIADGQKRSLGLFDKLEDAAAARKEAEREHGFHPNHGRKRA